MIRILIIIYIILGSLNVFSLTILGSIGSLINYSAILLMGFLLIIHLVYNKARMMKRHYAFAIYLIFFAVFISMFSAFFIYKQSFLVTFFAQRNIYFYLFYFSLHILKPGKQEFQRIIIYMGLLYFAVYMLQFLAFPTELLDVTMREERGTIRIYVEGAGYAMLAYYMCLQIFYSTKQIKYLLLSVVFIIPILLFGARSGILTIVLGTFAQLIFSKRVTSKALIVFLVLLAMVPTYMFFQDVFIGLVSATKVESSQGTENVRIMAAQYFMTKFLPNDIAFITGIGAPSERSALGRMTAMLSERYGYYLTDIGIIGNFVMYGVLFVFAVFMIVYKTIFMKMTLEMSYIKYFFFFEIFLLLPIAAGFAFSANIVCISCMLYLADISHAEIQGARETDTRPGDEEPTELQK